MMERIFGGQREMSIARVIWILAVYEMKKNIRKLLVLALVIIGILSVLGSVVIVNLILGSPDIPEVVKAPFLRYKWYIVLSMPQFFVSLISIAIGGGLFSSEYEDRTAYVLYTRPISRLTIFISKFSGGYLLITLLTLFYAVLAIGVSIIFFGETHGLWAAPYIVLATIYSQLIIYSLTLMFSQLTRRTILAMLIGVAIIIISPLVEGLLLTIEFLSEWILYILRLFPTWAMALPDYVASTLLPDFVTLDYTGDILTAVMIILGYFLLTSSITIYSLLKSDLVVD
jgi:ABC-2 type transport system permease protein